MKTMLSMPSTSSSAVSVARAIQACGSTSRWATPLMEVGKEPGPKPLARLQAAAKTASSRPCQLRFAAASQKLASKLLRASA